MKTKKHLLRRLPHYSAAAAAAAASAAHGSVIFFDSTHTFTVNLPAPVPGHQSFSTHNWDIDGNSVNDFKIYAQRTAGSFGSFDYNRINGQPLVAGNKWLAQQTFTDHYNTFAIKPLARGFVIGSHPASGGFQNNQNPLFLTNSGHPVGNLHTGNQYVGFEFLINGFTHYGWAEISISADSVTVKNWAYESTAGMSIMVPVPEPAGAPVGLGLLALGAAGVSAYRKRKLAK
ncbi:MAG TPA: hypothetical protein VHC95_07460 [Opitutales bacterium]|nr:hypothetical protein [Opitutales bacterium]